MHYRVAGRQSTRLTRPELPEPRGPGARFEIKRQTRFAYRTIQCTWQVQEERWVPYKAEKQYLAPSGEAPPLIHCVFSCQAVGSLPAPCWTKTHPTHVAQPITKEHFQGCPAAFKKSAPVQSQSHTRISAIEHITWSSKHNAATYHVHIHKSASAATDSARMCTPC